ncbi:DUF5641 domain-containing protein [Trichonephila clavipes]|nr:DUF5641 domain-containing protein [Trichonephila clavipes]
MGNLTYERVNMAPLFSITGLDLGGPYFVKRFMSRRGKCSKLFTDNATNFVGANSQLKVFYKTLNFPDQNLAAYFTEEGIEWNFIPPRAPHMGGLWEAVIKLVKYHLKRALGRSRLTYEEFETVIIQRGKWMIEKDNVMCGTMVIVKEDFTPVCNWLLGRVVEVYHGSDGKESRSDNNRKIESDRVTLSDSDRGEHRFRRTLNPRFSANEFTPSRSEVVFLKLSGIGSSAFLLAAAFAYLFARILAPNSVENRVSF